MKFCENCGNDLNENADVCIKCGKSVNKKFVNNKKWFIVIAILFGAAALLELITLFL